MTTAVNIAVVLLGGAIIGFILFFPMRWWYTRVEGLLPEDSRSATIYEIVQVAFIVPYLIVIIWVAIGANWIAALVTALLLMIANIAAYRTLKKRRRKNGQIDT